MIKQTILKGANEIVRTKSVAYENGDMREWSHRILASGMQYNYIYEAEIKDMAKVEGAEVANIVIELAKEHNIPVVEY